MLGFWCIRKICLCNISHFYIEKLGYAGVYLIFLFLLFAPKHRLWVLVRRFKLVPTIYVLSKNKKNIKNFPLKIFTFYNFFFKICIVVHRHVLVMKYFDQIVSLPYLLHVVFFKLGDFFLSLITVPKYIWNVIYQ